MLKKIIHNIGNSILFYADKEGHAIFRNYCITKHTGCAYSMELSKQEAGKILEYKLELDKKLNRIYIIVPLVVYLILIHMKFNLFSVLFCEFLCIFFVSLARLKASSDYSRFLNKNFGEYKLVEFSPHLKPEKQQLCINNFYAKLCLIIISIALFFIPAIFLNFGMKLALNSKKPHVKIAGGISKIYTTFYPKTEKIYDMQAFINYKNNDLKGAFESYKNILEMSGKKFGKNDYTRFANLIFLAKQLRSPQDAIDIFNDYITRKKLSTLEESKMLWIKSIFSIENNIADTVINDYDDLLTSLDPKDERNKFYITSDKAYMLYLMNEYEAAADIYDILIPYAEQRKKEYSNELKSLYAERAFARHKLGNNDGARADFTSAGIHSDEVNSYEPSFLPQSFIVDKF